MNKSAWIVPKEMLDDVKQKEITVLRSENKRFKADKRALVEALRKARLYIDGVREVGPIYLDALIAKHKEKV